MGGFSGKLGTVVGYMWRGRWCVRAHNPYPANPRTPRQVEHREMFRQEVQLAATMRAAVNKGFKEVSYELGMTPYNLFVHLNQHAFSLNEGVFTVDYSALRLSTGPLQEAVYGAPEWTADNVLTVRFEGGSGRWNDYVRLYVYCPEWSTGILTAPVYRKDKKVSVMLSDMFVGREVHVYGLVSNDEGLWAETTYIGSLVCDDTSGDGEQQTEESAQQAVVDASAPSAADERQAGVSSSSRPSPPGI